MRRYSELLIKFRWAIIVFWFVATALMVWKAPNLAEIAKNDQSSFLPDASKSVAAAKLEKKLFPDRASNSTVVITFFREGGLQDKDKKFGVQLEKDLIANKGKYTIQKIFSPLTDENMEESLISKDKKALIIMAGLTSQNYKESTNEIVRQMRKDFKGIPEGLQVNITGDAAMGQEQTDVIQKSMETTGVVTVALVVGILLAIYRSPIAPLVPLVTIGLSFMISRGAVALLSQQGLNVSSFTETFLVAILFGAGTDYCLLFISRFREELSQGHEKGAALINTLEASTEAVVSSAGTVTIGFLCMLFAHFGLFKTTGPAVAVGVVITLFAVMTFTPALMYVLGAGMFWPVRVKVQAGPHEEGSAFWGKLAQLVTSKPGRFLVGSLILLLPFMYFSTKIERSFDELQELPKTTDAIKGFTVIRNHFVQGEMLPIRLVIESSEDLWKPENLQVLNEITVNLRKFRQVEKVRSATQPLGEDLKEMSLVEQLTQLNSGMNKITKGINPLREGLRKMEKGVAKAGNGLETAGASLGKLAQGTKSINSGVKEVNEGLGKLRAGVGSSVKGLQQITPGLQQIKGGLAGVQGGLTSAQGDLLEIKGALEALAAGDPNLPNNPAYQQALLNVHESLAKVGATNTNLPVLIAGIEGSTGGINKVIGGLNQVNGGLKASSQGLNQVSAGLNKVAMGQQEGKTQLIAGSKGLLEVADGLDKSNDGLGKMVNGMNQGGEYVDDLIDGRKNIQNDSGFYLPEGTLEKYPELREGLEFYLTPKGSGTRMEIILNIPPYTAEALDSIDKLEESVRNTLAGTNLANAKFYLGGATAIYNDIRELTAKDFLQVMFFVLSGIFIILVILLRSIVAPIYLILTILLSYSATMGVTYLVFDVYGGQGISWSVPFFAFNLLVALGVDYNIFLMSRVKEECQQGDMTLGINRALAKTGGIITSCGIIMAGTFGALMASPINQMIQIGFATVIGLLMDTFVIRCILVPAIAVKLGELNWWPSKQKVKIATKNHGQEVSSL